MLGLPSHQGQTFRGLMIAGPGRGKTYFAQLLERRWPARGLASDPYAEHEKDFGPMPARFAVLYGRGGRHSAEQIAEFASELPEGSLLVLDEAHRFIRPQDTVENSTLLELLDQARNLGLSWVAATKHATLLPPLITTCASHIIYAPTRTPAGRDWLSRAGLDPDANPSRPRSWIVVKGEEVFDWDARELLTEALSYGTIQV